MKLSLFTSDRSLLAKEFRLVDGEIRKVTHATLYSGTAETCEAATPAALLALLEGLSPRQALSTGLLKEGHSAAITSTAKPRDGAVARTLGQFHYPEEPGWLVWDFDAATMPQDVADRIEALGGPLAALFHIWPEAKDAPYVIRPSSSGGVSAPDCAELASSGLHGFFLIEDVSRSRETLEALQTRAWAAGLAWIALSKSGALLVRSIVDVAVGSPERLIFEAPPIIVPPVTRNPMPSIVSVATKPVPVPLVDDATMSAAARAEAAARQAIQPEAARVEAAFIESRAQADAQKTGRPIEEARLSVCQMLRGAVLSDDHLIELRDGSVVRVGDLLDAPERYDRLSLPDPIEGLPYGPDKATLLIKRDPARADIGPRLVSHAHGARTVYRFARYEQAFIQRVPNSATPDEIEPPPTLPTALEARAAIAAAVEAFFQDVAAHNGKSVIQAAIYPEGPLHVLAAGLGLGKTTAALAGSIMRLREQLLRHKDEMREYERELELFNRLMIESDVEPEPPKRPAAMILVPMHRLSEQLLEEGQNLAPDLDFTILRGVDAEDPDARGEKVCKRIDEYHEEAALLFDPSSTICKGCQFATTCKAVASKEAKADIYLAAHGSLGNKPAALLKWRGQRLDHVIIDEDPTSALVFDDTSRRMGFAAWTVARSSGAELNLVRAKLEQAAIANGIGPLRREALVGAHIEPEDADGAADAEWSRKTTDRVAADLDDNRTVRRTAGIWKEVAAFLRRGTAVSGRLTVVQDKERGLSIQHIGVTLPHRGWCNAPVLMLDGTVEPKIVGAVMGRPPTRVTRAFADAPMLVIRQDPSKSGAKAMVLEHGWASESANRAARRWQQHLIKHIKPRAKRARRLLLVSTKELIRILQPELPANVATASFGALRGLNDFQDVDRVIIVGRWMPQQNALEARTAALFDVPVSGEIILSATVPRLARGESGVFWAYGKGVTHSHPLADMVLRSIRDAEVEQAIGRARAINRTSPVVVELLSDAIVCHPVEIAEIWRSISKDDPLVEMLAEGGVFIESPAHAAQAYPQLWKTKQAAQHALSELSTGQENSYSHLYEDCCPVRVCYRVPRRTETFTAGVDQRQHRDPVAAVRSAIPKAVEVRVIEESNVIALFRDGVIDLNLAMTGGTVGKSYSLKAGATQIAELVNLQQFRGMSVDEAEVRKAMLRRRARALRSSRCAALKEAKEHLAIMDEVTWLALVVRQKAA